MAVVLISPLLLTSVFGKTTPNSGSKFRPIEDVPLQKSSKESIKKIPSEKVCGNYSDGFHKSKLNADENSFKLTLDVEAYDPKKINVPRKPGYWYDCHFSST